MDSKAKTGMTPISCRCIGDQAEALVIRRLSVADVEEIVAAASFRRFAANSVKPTRESTPTNRS